MEELTLEQYLEQKNPEALKQYKRYLNRHNIPHKGQYVESLENGFGGPSGMYLRVVGRSTDPEFAADNYADDYIILASGLGYYLANTSRWWEQIEVIADVKLSFIYEG